ncbi:MAG: HK97 family phage prohead protease [Cohaesibacter sp.]|nr:HK97 family phage prohead protease [Cohaesibacter sp.]
MTFKTLTRPLSVKDISEKGEFAGYGSIFGNEDLYGDVVEKGAFVNSLKEKGSSGIKMLWQHDAHCPIGVFDKIEEDGKGLYVEGRLLIDVIDKAKEVYGLLTAKALDGLSIGYRTVRSNWDEKNNVRRLMEVDLWEISMVTFPCNLEATVTAVKSLRDLEGLLRDEGGFSRKEAAAIARGGFDGLKAVRESREQSDDLSSALQRMAEQFGA